MTFFLHVQFCIFLGLSGLVFDHLVEANGVTFRNCGGVYTEPKGVISTPSFPGPYPTPISCEWLIHAPHGKKIIIYFTQFYMKDSFYITEYEYYQDKTTYIGRHSLGRISWEHGLTSLAAYKPYVLIEFEVESIGNRHLRVIDHLLEVYGFNITYEILDKSTDVTKQTCSVSECSFLGNCLVSADFQSYKCHCFDKFFGENCQYGPYCDPDNGINQCTNGGRCKYFFGSLINQCECPPGFAGPYCEISEIPESANGRSAACMELQCKHLCDIDADGKAHCVCYDGYKMHKDNGTCIPIARYRMDVTLELDPFEPISDAVLEEQLEEVEPIILETIKENGVTTATKFGIQEIRRRRNGASLKFFFYCKVSEVKLIKPALQALIDSRQVGIFQIKPQVPSYEESPELMIAEVSNFNMSPATRGELLTLVCAAKGSRNIQFQWYKDGFAVDTSLTLRNTWISTIPDTVHGMQLSVLNIDNVGPLDKGVFKCEVEDFGETQQGSVDVTVDNYPRVELSPMSLSVLKGGMISIKCMSPDISLGKISYEWFKNGVKIDSKGLSEYAEDMNPAGVRLVAPAVTQDAEYTCKVTNNAGSANVSAYVSVIAASETHLICQHTFEGQIHWQNTSGGHFYIERCPTEHGDISETMQIGYATRNCICDPVTNECEWGEPNFAKCQSLDLIKVYDELQSLRSGYQQTTLKSVFDKLYLFTFPKKSVLIFSGDMDMVAHILKDFMVHLKNFPQLANEDQPLSVEKLVQLVSGILKQSHTATPEEKRIILVGPCIVHTLSTLFSGAVKSVEYKPKSPISTLNVDMTVQQARLVAAPEGHLEVKTQEAKELTRHRRDEPWTHEKVMLVKSRHLSDLLTYRHMVNSKSTKNFSEIVSSVYSAAFYTEKSRAANNTRVELTISHDKLVNIGSQNKAVCLSWVYDPSNLQTGMWKNTSCAVRSSTKMETVCNCRLPGHFVVAVISSNFTEPVPYSSLDHTIHIPLVVGYILSLFILIVACVIYLKACRMLVGDIYCVHFSLIWCLLAASVTSLLCLLNIADQRTMQEILQIFLSLFYMSAQTHLVIEMFTVFTKAYRIDTIQFDKLKYILICWSVPSFILIPIVILSKTTDHSISCNLICWYSTEMKHFYVYILSTAFFTLTFLVFISSSIVSFRTWNVEWRYADRVRYLKQIGKSSIIFLLLIVSTITSLNLQNSSQSAQIALHMMFHICLCLSVLLFRCIFDKQIRCILERMCVTWDRNPDQQSEKNSRSFRAFMKPEKVSNVQLSQEEYNVSEYYDEVNRTKYTAERKRHLSLLLGSSVGGESGYASVDRNSASVSNSNASSKESALSPITTEDKSSENGGNDSGIYDFQEVTNTVPEEGEGHDGGHSKSADSRSRLVGGPRVSSPHRVRIMDNGASNIDKSAGLKPVMFQCYGVQSENPPHNQDKQEQSVDGKVSKEHSTHFQESQAPYDLDQVIYYPHYKKPSSSKSKTEKALSPSKQEQSTEQDDPSEVAALIHVEPEQDDSDDNMSTTSQLLPLA